MRILFVPLVIFCNLFGLQGDTDYASTFPISVINHAPEFKSNTLPEKDCLDLGGDGVDGLDGDDVPVWQDTERSNASSHGSQNNNNSNESLRDASGTSQQSHIRRMIAKILLLLRVEIPAVLKLHRYVEYYNG
jgi:hypothetical protein